MAELMTREASAATARDLAGRAGYDAGFLGVPVPIPELPGVETVLLPYTHFSVLMRLDKRLAAVTALGVDGKKLMNLDRAGVLWRLDPRLPADQQTGERVYAHNDIDRGHLVRRASAVCGDTRAEAEQANEDTFHYTNAAPQAAKFNQGMQLWLGLESYLQEHAADNSRRIVVFTGPIFGPTDPVCRGVDIPLKFFKVADFPPGREAGRHRLRRGPDTLPGRPAGRPPARGHRRRPTTRALPDLPGPHPGHRRPHRTGPGPARGRGPGADRLGPARRAGHRNWRELHSPEDLDLDFDLGG
ncbi:DNA/RNA non-specific endonuclease [Arthrobacter sp. FW306-05-C]|uniref:DNA/RNA non-specific endonuclease n=1 Tax=Arthrobacter sp. FW306-05-C TaxID=2879620 RepID=UPI001F01E3D6|nr:DNA/RNA non-specific endonuclease [Arthrobacter sp. FW306-05-C]UKA68385.1 DNA/RNA non-specific endonuclease [Arthrobacter sp. FW306-05-C]